MSLIKEKISIRCKEKKISLKNLALKVGMTEAGLLRSFKTNSLKVSTLKNVCDILDIEPAYLINDNIETLIEGYRSLSDELISIIMELHSEYGEFVNILIKYCEENPKIKKDINDYFYTTYSKEYNKINNKIDRNLSEKRKYLTELMSKSDIETLPKNRINKESINDITKNLKKEMARSEALIKIISDLDKGFDPTMISALYDFHINPT